MQELQLFTLLEYLLPAASLAELNQAILLLPMWLLYMFIFILSACVASFINVVVYRLPLIYAQNTYFYLKELSQENIITFNDETEFKKSQGIINLENFENFENFKNPENINSEKNNAININDIHIPKPLTLSNPNSHCPNCKQSIPFYLNIPIMAWLWLKIFYQGGCRYCKQKVASSYVLVEFLLAILSTVFIAYALGHGFLANLNTQNPAQNLNLNFDFISLIFLLLFFWQLSTIILLDAKTQLMPNELTVPFIITGLLFNIYQDVYGLKSVLAIGAQNALIEAMLAYFLLWLFSRIFSYLKNSEGLGGGDIYLFAGFAAWFGLGLAFYAIFAAAVLGLLYLLFVYVFFKRKLDQAIAFGPFLGVGLLLALFFI